jgi:thiol-disulfide isomerase/thioredoxin
VVAVLVAVVIIAAIAGGDNSKESNTGIKIEEVRAVDILAGTSLASYDDAASTDDAIGQTAPHISGATLEGDFVSTLPEDGNYKMIVFLAHWCPHCQREVPRLVDWAAAGEVPDNLDVMAVSTAVDESRGNYPPSEWLTDEGWKYPIMADDSVGTAASSFGLSSFPYFVLLSPDNEVLARRSGEIEIDDLKALLTSAMGPVN